MVGVGVVVELGLGLTAGAVGLPVGGLTRVAVGVNRLGVGTFGGSVGKGSVGAKVGKGGVGGTCHRRSWASSGAGAWPAAQASRVMALASISLASHFRRLAGLTGGPAIALRAGSRAAICPTAAELPGRP